MEAATKEVNHHILAVRISTEIKNMLQYKSFYYELQVGCRLKVQPNLYLFKILYIL